MIDNLSQNILLTIC